MDTQTNNKLIAKFMGHQVNFGFKRNGVLFHGVHVGIDKLLYHKSWDWLMPVVDKIESLGYGVEILGNYCKIGEIQCSQLTKIQAVYKAITEFIKWYNNDKRTKDS